MELFERWETFLDSMISVANLLAKFWHFQYLSCGTKSGGRTSASIPFPRILAPSTLQQGSTPYSGLYPQNQCLRCPRSLGLRGIFSSSSFRPANANPSAQSVVQETEKDYAATAPERFLCNIFGHAADGNFHCVVP